MQRGWQHRRMLEDETGQRLLQWAERSGVPLRASFAACTTKIEQFRYLAALGRRCDEATFEELAAILGAVDEEIRWAARTAMRLAAERAIRAAQAKRLKTIAPQAQTAMPSTPAATNVRSTGRPPTASSATR